MEWLQADSVIGFVTQASYENMNINGVLWRPMYQLHMLFFWEIKYVKDMSQLYLLTTRWTIFPSHTSLSSVFTKPKIKKYGSHFYHQCLIQ
jgi:hypothetical protein